MRVLMVSARRTPSTTAIGDYTVLLTEALNALPGITVEHAEPIGGTHNTLPDWRLLQDLRRRTRPDLVHLQYPMTAFGRSPVPALLGLQTRAVVTLHEARSWGRKMPLMAGHVTLRAPAVLVTSEYERDGLAAALPWLRGKFSVVPIGNNVGVAPPQDRAPARIVMFGKTRRWRGFEEFLAFAALVRQAGLPWDLRIIGNTRADAYSQEIVRRGQPLGITFTGFLPEAEAAAELARATLGYFPFPEGAGERHGSLLAAFANGLPVVSNFTGRTPAEYRASIAEAPTPAAAIDAIKSLLGDPARRDLLAARGRDIAAARSWEHVAQLHLQTYQRLLSR